MRTITVSYGPEDAWEFSQSHLAPHAWSAIDACLLAIRNHFKHDHLSTEQCLLEVQAILFETKAKLGE